MLNPEFPVVSGSYQMTRTWSVTLPLEFNRRLEDGSLVLWRAGFTMWIAVYGNSIDKSARYRLDALTNDLAPEAFDLVEETEDGLLRFAYRLREESDDTRVPAFYCLCMSKDGHALISMYFDEEKDVAVAQEIWRSLRDAPVH